MGESDLLEMRKSRVAMEQELIAHYIVGVYDALQTREEWRGPRVTCKPPAVCSGQLEKVVIKGLNEAPAKLHQTASSLVINVIRDAYPCD